MLIIAAKKDDPINEKIRAEQLLIIGPNGEKMGIKSKEDALTLAKYAGFDLVCISPNAKIPVAKLMDYNKFKYEKQKKRKESKKRQKDSNIQIKEYRFSPAIDVHDFNTKLKNARKYLEKGARIKLSIRFKGRAMAHTELGEKVLLKFAEATSDIAEVESRPKLDGRNMMMFIATKKDK